jgi:hypothetical protein
MRSPALGIAWLLWRRNRWGFIALLGYGSSLVLMTRAWPSTSAAVRLQLFAAALPLFFGLLHLMAAFAYPEADLVAAAPGFPRAMLLLPVRTRELVFWPMLTGCATVALAWIAFARWILIPNGMSVPVGWMAAMLAALLAWLQALCWSSVGLPYLRLILGLVLLPLLPALGDVATLNGVSPAALTSLYIALIPVAYGAATAGVARARCGDSPEWGSRASMALATWSSPGLRGASASRHANARWTRPFATPAHAQFWLEWRRNGMMLPLFVAGVGLLLTLPLIWLRDLAPMGAGGALPTPALKDLELNAWVGLQKGAFLWPVVLAAIVGCGLRTSDARRKDYTLHPFLATRPLTSGALVMAKLQMAALSTLAAWGVMLLFIAVWLLTPAREGDRSGTLAALLLRHCSPKTGVTLLLGLIALIGWTWMNQVQGLFILLSGRRWLIYGYPAAVYGLLLAAFLAFFHWDSGERDRALAHAVPHLAPWLVGAAVTLKAVAAGWALQMLHRRRLASARALAGLAAVWVLLAIGLFALLSGATWEGDLAGFGVPPSLLTPRYLAAAAALFVPLTRLALAPLALAWNRHR